MALPWRELGVTVIGARHRCAGCCSTMLSREHRARCMPLQGWVLGGHQALGCRGTRAGVLQPEV